MPFVLAAGVGALVVALADSVVLGAATGLAGLVVVLAVIAWTGRRREMDPDRRRFLALTGTAGLAWVAGGTAIGAVARRLARPDPRPVQQAMARELGGEYMELVRRAYHPGRSGDLQLLLAPFNSSNYASESTSLVQNDPRSSHASVWMYLQRVPLVVYAPGRVSAADSVERVSLADLAPTTAALMGFDGFPSDRSGTVLPNISANIPAGATPPKVIVTFVIDGGGWNVLRMWNDRWPNLKRLMREGANYRNALTGSFPAVTACAHATIGTGAFPDRHGITGHNIRDGASVRKAYREVGAADPSDILVPTLADLWSTETGNRAWIGELGYQVWHVGMIGFGGRDRPAGDKPVAVFWDSDHGGGWAPQHPDLYRTPNEVPGLDVWEAHRAAFVNPGWDAQFYPKGTANPCCDPPIAQYQGDLIQSTFDSEPVGETGTTDLLYINFKTPDYTGHVYNMESKWEGLMIEAVDVELGRLVRLLDERFPGDYALIVTADHGQCPLPDDTGGVRLDPIQLQKHIDGEFAGIRRVVQEVVPSEVYLYTDRLWDVGASPEDVAAFLGNYAYRRNIGPYVPRSAIEQDLMDRQEFAAVLATSYLDTLDSETVGALGESRFSEADQGIPPAPD